MSTDTNEKGIKGVARFRRFSILGVGLGGGGIGSIN